jgi:hypothetical protein
LTFDPQLGILTQMKRDAVKFVRDRAKARYKKGSECFICGSTDRLDFHHFYTLTPLLNKWLKKQGIKIETDEDILAVRDQFIEEHLVELYDETVTICHTHHLKLHSVYGKDPALTTAEKQKRWVQIQREKNGLPRLGT